MEDRTLGKLLIVDDLRINRLILAELFQPNYEVIEAENGLEAIDVLNSEKDISAMLLDVVMPKMNGFGVLDYMNKTGLINRIPVLFVTGDTSLDTAIKGFESGVIDIITKPMINPVIVRKRVDNAIQMHCRQGQTLTGQGMMFHGGLSDYALEIFERERQKTQWFQEMSDEITFDYNVLDDRMEVSEKFMEVFGDILDGSAAAYIRSGKLIKRDDVRKILKGIQELTPMNPIYCTKVLLETKKHTEEHFELYLRAMWDHNQKDDNRPVGYIGKLVSEKKYQTETQQWRKKALRDYLTGTMNRQALWSRLEELLAEEETADFSVLFLDLDGFKHVNDARGHEVGDVILRKTAELLVKNVRASDYVARVGSDEFIVILNGTSDAKIVEMKVQSMQKALTEDEDIAGLTSSMGIAHYPKDGKEINVLIQKADRALYEAKGSDQNSYEFYREELKNKAYESFWSPKKE